VSRVWTMARVVATCERDPLIRTDTVFLVRTVPER
jgi:hypothetical protein